MTDFDASPRETKRRRTGTYATKRTTLSSIAEPVKDAKKRTRRSTNAIEPEEEIQNDSSGGREEDPVIAAEDTTSGEPATGSNSKRRRSKILEKPSKNEVAAHNGTSAKKSRNRSTNDVAAEELAHEGEQDHHLEETDAQPRSSGRVRRPPRRFLSPDEEPSGGHGPSSETQPTSKLQSRSKQSRSLPKEVGESVQSPQPKGILTPSRRGRDKRTGQRKSVVFAEDEEDEEGQIQRQIEEQLGFKDVSSSVKKGKKRQSQRDTLNTQADEDTTVHNTADTDGVENDDEQDDTESLLDQAPDLDDILSLSQHSGTNLEKHADLCTPEPEDEHLTKIKMEVLNRMTKHTLSPISHLEAQYASLHSLLAATVSAGESNSLLLLGSRGSGKSLLISHALADLTKSHDEDFHVVRLNGFFQTDDKLALREIWRQLGREMAVSEDETGEVSSYADTMASLLSLLSHPDELLADPDSMVIDHAEEGGVQHKTSKSVIFVLDEFDLFTTHARQTLLYNLFDIAQARKAPIAVIGCSTRMDVVDCLEKRVKSRFSHRWLHVPNAKSFVAFEEAVSKILSMPVDGKEALGVAKDDLEWRERWNQSIKMRFLPSSAIQDAMKRTFYSTKSIPDLLAELYIPIATLSLSSLSSEGNKHAEESWLTSSPPSLLTLLPHLPIIHLSLLIAAARLEAIYDAPVLNFTLAHRQYTDLLARAKLQRSSAASFTKGGALTGTGLRSWSKDTARAAWEELVQWEFLVPASGVVGAAAGKMADDAPGGDGVATRMVRVDVTLDEVAWAVKEKFGAVGTLGEMLVKWCKEV